MGFFKKKPKPPEPRRATENQLAYIMSLLNCRGASPPGRFRKLTIENASVVIERLNAEDLWTSRDSYDRRTSKGVAFIDGVLGAQ